MFMSPGALNCSCEVLYYMGRRGKQGLSSLPKKSFYTDGQDYQKTGKILLDDHCKAPISTYWHQDLLMFMQRVWAWVADPGFSCGGATTLKGGVVTYGFCKNCIKMKEFEPQGSFVPPSPRSANGLSWLNLQVSFKFILTGHILCV